MPEVLALGAVADLGFGAEAALVGGDILGGAAEAGAGAAGGLDLLGGAELGGLGLDAGLGAADLGLGAADVAGLGADVTGLGADVGALGGDIGSLAAESPEAIAAAGNVAPLEGAAIAPDVGGGLGAEAAGVGGDIATGAAEGPTGIGAELGGGGGLGTPELNQFEISAGFGGEPPPTTGDIGGGSIGETFSAGPQYAPLDPGDALTTPGGFGPEAATNPMLPDSFEAQTLGESLDMSPTGESNMLGLEPTPGGEAVPDEGRFAVADLGDNFAGQGLGDFANLETGTTFNDLGFAPADTGGLGGNFTAAGEAPPSIGPFDTTVNFEPSGLGADMTDLGAGAGGAPTDGVAGGAGGGGAGGAGAGVLSSLGLGGLGLSPAQLLGAGALGGFALMGPGKISSAGQLEGFNARQLAGSGRQMIADAQAGRITAAQQAQLDEMLSSGEAQLRTQFARMGRDPNTDSSFQYALAQLRSQVTQQRQQFINALMQQGLQELSLAQQSLGQVAQLQTQRDVGFQSALANALGAATRLASGVRGPIAGV